MLVIVWAFFVLAACCYLLFITSEPLERVGGRIGRLLRLPEDVIGSTFQAMATSGPEICLAILAATAFVAQDTWKGLELEEKASSGCLNMCFSAMHNLIGIGSVGIIYMLAKKTVRPDEVIDVSPSAKVGLIFYTVSSACLSVFILDGQLTRFESWVLMVIGISFVICQFIVPGFIRRRAGTGGDTDRSGDCDDAVDEDSRPLPDTTGGHLRDLARSGFVYAALVYALVIFVRECLGASFDLASMGIASVGGVLILFTSYVSSFPEFMLAYRYAKSVKKGALLGMLFGSNVVDLSFAGFRAIWLGDPMAVETTGHHHELLPVYIWALPAIAFLSLAGLWMGKVKFKHAYYVVAVYAVYVISGFVLL